MVIEIKKAEYIGKYKIQFKFSDGTERLVDFEAFLKSAKNPMTQKYLSEDNFKQFELKHGDIIWNDYEMCFPIWSLYENNI